MALKRQFTDEDIKSHFDKFDDTVNERIFEALKRGGLEFVTDARNQPQDHNLGTYIDRTTNLRNSIGFFIYKDGEKIYGDGGAFSAEMEIVAMPYVRPNGYQLIGFAGMDYAGYVQAKGYNVIANQAETCIISLGQYMNDITQYINNNYKDG